MAGFLYARPGDDRPVTLDHIARWGLGYAFTRGPEFRPALQGPSGKRCGVFADAERHRGKTVGYFADQQTWRKLPDVDGRPELWVGFWNDARPTPDCLMRDRMLRGPMIRLADGNAWQIPIVRRFDDAAQSWQCELPALLDFDASGKVVRGAPLAEYAALWDLTAPLADQRLARESGDAGATPIADEQLYAAIFALLRANYTVDMPELLAIGALADDDTIALIVMAATRYDALLAWLEGLQKKTESPSTPNGATTSAGAAA